MRFPTLAEVLSLHDRLIVEFGGEAGTRHTGAVEAALARMEHGPFETGDLAERAALLLRGIVEDHPLVDGNKRTGFTVAETFLRSNGWCIPEMDDQVVEFGLSVARGQLSLDEITEWLRSKMERI